jgi:hypothetical protein
MAQEGKIVDFLGTKDGKSQFVIELPEEVENDGSPVMERIKIAHDYVEFYGACSFEMKSDKEGTYPYKSINGASNWLNSKASIQIGIREMYDVIIPLLLNSEYLQEEHFKPRIYSEDDKYYSQYGYDEPRYNKGDKYPAYVYFAAIVSYFDTNTNTSMVKFRRANSDVWETVTHELFVTIRPSLKLYYSKDELKLLDK